MTKKHRRNRLEENNVERFAWVFLSAMCILFLFPMVVAVMISICPCTINTLLFITIPVLSLEGSSVRRESICLKFIASSSNDRPFSQAM